MTGWRRRRKFGLRLILGRGAYATFRDVTPLMGASTSCRHHSPWRLTGPRIRSSRPEEVYMHSNRRCNSQQHSLQVRNPVLHAVSCSWHSDRCRNTRRQHRRLGRAAALRKQARQSLSLSSGSSYPHCGRSTRHTAAK